MYKYECKICKKSFNGWGAHFKNNHKDVSTREYYDKYLKKENEGVCVVCGKETNFINANAGYYRACGYACSNVMMYREKPEIKEKIGKTSKDRWQNDKEFKNKMKRCAQEHSVRMKGVKKSVSMKRKLSAIATRRHIESPEGFVGEKTRYKQGYYFSKKNNKELYYQSSYELLAFNILEQQDAVVKYEKCKFSIDYVKPSDNFTHKYVPDILVIYDDGRKQIIEIKAEWQLEDEIVKAKQMAAKEKFGDEYAIWSEKDLQACLI
jgi:hypothetical protein